jgi:hypothetical protein
MQGWFTNGTGGSDGGRFEIFPSNYEPGFPSRSGFWWSPQVTPAAILFRRALGTLKQAQLSTCAFSVTEVDGSARRTSETAPKAHAFG